MKINAEKRDISCFKTNQKFKTELKDNELDKHDEIDIYTFIFPALN